MNDFSTLHRVSSSWNNSCSCVPVASGDVSFKLAIQVRGKPYRLTVTRETVSLVPEGKRRGIELPWSALVDEDAEMMSALHRTMKRLSGRRGR